MLFVIKNKSNKILWGSYLQLIIIAAEIFFIIIALIYFYIKVIKIPTYIKVFIYIIVLFVSNNS